MRIVIDLQGLQNDSRFRGIGRYSLSLARAIAQQAGSHEVWLAASSQFPDRIADLRAGFDGLVPAERIAVFDVPGPVAEHQPPNAWRSRAAELIREHFLAALRPDIVHISSLFEGFGDDSVTSIGLSGLEVPTAATLYDLIPLLHPETYLGGEAPRGWYTRKVASARRSDVLLAISEYSAEEALRILGMPEDHVAVIGTGIDEQFRPQLPDPERDARLRRTYGLHGPFVLYTGAADPRKNLNGLLQAMAALPPALRDGHVLACAGKLYNNQREDLVQAARSFGISEASLLFLGYVPDADLVVLYGLCELFVFPSLYEGFGLPAAEAMACGAPVIGSNTTSIPEVIGRADALFDPTQPADIARCMERVLSSKPFSDELSAHGIRRAATFTWEAAAARTIAAYEALHDRNQQRTLVQVAAPDLASPATPGSLRRLAMVQADDSTALELVAGMLAARYDITRVKVGPGMGASARSLYHDAAWFQVHGREFDAVLYAPSDAASATPFVDLLEAWPGIVLLPTAEAHGYPAGTDAAAENWREPPQQRTDRHSLYYSRGLAAVLDRHRGGSLTAAEPDDTALPGDEAFHRLADGMLVHDAGQIAIARRWYGEEAAARMHVVPLPATDATTTEAWARAIDICSSPGRPYGNRLLDSIVTLAASPGPGDLFLAATCIAANQPRFGLPQLLIDVSTIAVTDAHTGIQRVVRSILSELASAAPHGWRVEPVRAHGDGYVYARDFTARFLGLEPDMLPPEALVETHRGDIFLGLDLAAQEISPRRGWFEVQRLRGVTVNFVVYDLLPVRWPERFPEFLTPLFHGWINAVAEIADGVLCISQAVAEEFADWYNTAERARPAPPRLGWFHLGADLQASVPTRGLLTDSGTVLETLRQRPFLLSVGTLEPRKGYSQTLDAFDLLWADGVDVGLVIVGRAGWGTETLVARLNGHPELKRRLLWLHDVSDEMLTLVYARVAGLLAASEGEGFGLPLIEAAQHGLPILARDLPVFREIAGNQATYFSAVNGQGFAAALKAWFNAWNGQRHVTSEGMQWLTWRKSVMQMMQAVLHDGWQMNIEPVRKIEPADRLSVTAD